MKHFSALVLLGLSVLLALVVFQNVYAVIASAGIDYVPSALLANWPHNAILVTVSILAIVCFASGIAILSQRGKS